VRLNSDEYVREQYRTTENLEARVSVWQSVDLGASPQDVAVRALLDVRPRRVLEVGSGKGNLALRISREVHCEVQALDSSAAMVAASSSLGVETMLGDVRDLPFPDSSFDAVIAAWMLYHVRPVESGLAELARVLRPEGRLIAVTNGAEHLAELWNSVDAQRDELTFSAENGTGLLGEFFDHVERHDTATRATFADREMAVAYLRSVDRGDLLHRVPLTGWPLHARGATTVFVADRPK
jgi:SAM-dependent methyltransferase